MNSYGQYGSNYYAKDMESVFQPVGQKKNVGYWAVTSPTFPAQNWGQVQNVYRKYTYLAEIVDPPGWDRTDYDYGDPVQVKVTVRNTGEINILPLTFNDLRVRVYLDPGPLRKGRQIGDQSLLTPAEFRAGGLTTSKGVLPRKTLTFNFNLPDPSGPNSIWELCSDEDILVEVYYGLNPTIIDSKTFEVPGTSISFIPTVIIDGISYRLENKTIMNADNTSAMYWGEQNYVLDTAVVNIYTEGENDENYTKTIVSIENPDEKEHQYTFKIPLYGRGDAVYIPSMGSVITNTGKIEAKTNYLIFYNQSDYDYVSVYEFSNEAIVEQIEFFEDNEIRGVNVTTSWNVTLAGSSSNDRSIYFSRRQPIMPNFNLDFSGLYTTFAKEIVDNGDSLMNLKISAPEEVRVAETIPKNVTVFNNGIVEETLNLFVNVSRTPLYSRTQKIIYTDTTSISVSPNTEKTLTYPVYISKDTAATVWDINVATDKGIGAKASFAVEDAFDLNCTRNITVEQYSMFTFDTTVTNTWDVIVHDVNVTIDLFYGFNTSDSIEQQIGDLLPNEKRTISWQLNVTSSGELPIDVLVTSDDGGYDTISSTITSLSPPVLWIPNNITHTDAPDFGTSKTVCMNVTLQNLGDLTANSVHVQLLLPENVTSTASKHDIGDLLGGEQKNVPIDITFSTQNDFAFDVIAKDDANHSAIGTMMMSFSAITLPDLTLTSDDIRVIHSPPNSTHSTQQEQTTLTKDIYKPKTDLNTIETLIYLPTVNPNQTFRVMEDTNYSFSTTTYSSTGIRWDLRIKADKTEVPELTVVKLTVMGVPGMNIQVKSDPVSDNAYFPGGLNDNPKETTNEFDDVIDEDGIGIYAVEFNDTGTYTIKVLDKNDPSTYTDTVDITVTDKAVIFDVPDIVIIGERFTIKGTANTGDTVTIAVEDEVVQKLDALVIAENGEFKGEIDTSAGDAPAAFKVPGSVRLRAYISRSKASSYPDTIGTFEKEDGAIAVLMTIGELTAELSTNAVAQGYDFTIIGYANGSKGVDILIVAPEGFRGSNIEGGKGMYHSSTSVTTSDGSFYKKINVGDDVDTGAYLVMVLSPGSDGVWGKSGYPILYNPINPADPNSALGQYTLDTMTQEEMLDVGEGSTYLCDDLLWIDLKDVESSYVLPATISATIHNIGTADASNIVVQFFDGDPDAGGTQIGTDQIITSIAHISTGTAQVTWTAIPGTHDIFVRVDPYDSIQEANENNNQAHKPITIEQTYNQPPIASSTYSPLNPIANETIMFNATNSYDPDGFIINYEWEFGDDIAATGEIVEHSYSKPGDYTVILRVTDIDNVSNTNTMILTITMVEAAICGDVTGDNKVTMGDARRIEMWLLYPEDYPINNLWAADVTGDGEVTGDDARRIIMWLSDPEQYPLVSCQGYNVARNITYVFHNKSGMIEYEKIYRDTCQR